MTLYYWIVDEFLHHVPELAEEYGYQRISAQESDPLIPDEYKQISADLEARYPSAIREPPGEPGLTLLFEDQLVPLIVELGRAQQEGRVSAIFHWIEDLAKHPSFDVRNLVASGVCESLITTHASVLPAIVRFMGPQTKALCVMQFDQYIIPPQLQALLRS